MITRRDALRTMGSGFGMLALAALTKGAESNSPLAPKRLISLPGPSGHFSLSERRAIAGRHLRSETHATKYHGQPMPTPNLKTERKTGNLLKSPFTFKKYGQSGIEVQRDLLPGGRMHRRRLCHSFDAHRPAQP